MLTIWHVSLLDSHIQSRTCRIAIASINLSTSYKVAPSVVPLIATVLTVGTGITFIVNCWFLQIVVQCARHFRKIDADKTSFTTWFGHSLLFFFGEAFSHWVVILVPTHSIAYLCHTTSTFRLENGQKHKDVSVFVVRIDGCIEPLEKTNLYSRWLWVLKQLQTIGYVTGVPSSCPSSAVIRKPSPLLSC